MKRMRKCNDEVYQLAKEQALVKKLENKRFNRTNTRRLFGSVKKCKFLSKF
jgi:hypothetical protein